MLKDLIKLANHLDQIGMSKEADYIDQIIKEAGFIDSVKGFFGLGSEPDKNEESEDNIPDEESVMRERKRASNLIQSHLQDIANLYSEDSPMQEADGQNLNEFGQKLYNSYIESFKENNMNAFTSDARRLMHSYLIPTSGEHARFLGISHEMGRQPILMTITRRGGKREKAIDIINILYEELGLSAPRGLKEKYL